jgi:hypothetical protein
MTRSGFLAGLVLISATARAMGVVAAEVVDGGVYAQDLRTVSASDKIAAALWTRRPDSYTLQLVLDRSRYALPFAPAPSVPAPSDVKVGSDPESLERNSFFIGATIANLRCLDPDFGGRTLTLVDGRRTPGQQPPAPATPAQRPQSNPQPLLREAAQVQAWLLRADGTQIMPVRQSPQVQSGACGARPNPYEILYRVSVADGSEAVAVAMRIDDEYYIENLRSLVPGAAL